MSSFSEKVVIFGPAFPMNLTPLWVIAYDQPGFGHTGLPEDYSLEYRVQHAKAFMDALGLTRYHLIGNSVGAYIAARLALEDPRVDRLVLISSSVLVPSGSNEAAALAREHSAALRALEPSLESVRSMTLKTLYKPELVTEELVQARYEMSSGQRYDAQLARRTAPPQRSILDELPGPEAEDDDPLGQERSWRGRRAGVAAV